MSMGTVVSLPFSGFLAETFGWQWVFYVLGGLAAIWCILWIFLVFDSPQQHPRLHPEEKKLFHFSLSAAAAEGKMTKKKMKLSVPWKAIFTSGPFWAILIAHTCKNFGWYMLLVELPTYMKHILRFNIGRVLTAFK
jgi:ACS family sodium-dependent inorganic phosphate cotransporter